MIWRATLLGLALVIATALPVLAAEHNKVDFRRSDSIADFLARSVGKRVEIILSSGKSLSGTVQTVSTHGVQLARLVGKDFFDALVPFRAIGAVVVRARGG